MPEVTNALTGLTDPLSALVLFRKGALVVKGKVAEAMLSAASTLACSVPSVDKVSSEVLSELEDKASLIGGEIDGKELTADAAKTGAFVDSSELVSELLLETGPLSLVWETGCAVVKIFSGAVVSLFGSASGRYWIGAS